MIFTGVYCITNTKNWKVYVGGAYQSFEIRWKTHKKDLNKGKHFNSHLQRAWNKYGETCFTFEVIERCGPDEKVISERETYWIKTLDATNSDKGYNKRRSGRTGLPVKPKLPTHKAGSVISPGGFIMIPPPYKLIPPHLAVKLPDSPLTPEAV